METKNIFNLLQISQRTGKKFVLPQNLKPSALSLVEMVDVDEEILACIVLGWTRDGNYLSMQCEFNFC
jgi:hypothetical protein